MPNTWFAFKQFTVQQDKCAMKVTSDACLFGAWVAQTLATGNKSPKSILDVGTGTGLLSLMIAQAFPSAKITGLDIDDDAVQQAAENFRRSPWSQNLTARHDDVFLFKSNRTFDLILCNPPFFENQLPRKTERENLAAHSGKNWLKLLLEKLTELAAPNGILAILLPADRLEACTTFSADAGWRLYHVCRLSARPGLSPYRCFLIFKLSGYLKIADEQQMSMYGDETLSDSAATLLRNYYLKL